MTGSNRSGNQSGDGTSWGKYGESLYKYWVDTHSHNHVKKWLRKHKYDMKSVETKEYIEYMRDGFINWINRDR